VAYTFHTTDYLIQKRLAGGLAGGLDGQLELMRHIVGAVSTVAPSRHGFITDRDIFL
jgi:hypothetical protein